MARNLAQPTAPERQALRQLEWTRYAREDAAQDLLAVNQMVTALQGRMHGNGNGNGHGDAIAPAAQPVAQLPLLTFIMGTGP
jgi:hypothetical protein